MGKGPVWIGGTAREDTGQHRQDVDLRPYRAHASRAPTFVSMLLAVAPLLPIQFVLRRVVEQTARSHPELFARLGEQSVKRFLIDPIDIPMILLLVPDARKPRLVPYRRTRIPPHDARISATLRTLLLVIDGTLDSDGLFFHRHLHVSGDVDAAVALRNALDDYNGSIVDDALRTLGPLHCPASAMLSRWRTP